MVAIVAPPPPSNHFPLFLDLERQQVGGGKGGKWEIGRFPALALCVPIVAAAAPPLSVIASHRRRWFSSVRFLSGEPLLPTSAVLCCWRFHLLLLLILVAAAVLTSCCCANVLLLQQRVSTWCCQQQEGIEGEEEEQIGTNVSSCSVHPCRRHNSMARWLKLEKDDKRRLCQWWWRHWNAILVVILDMGIVKARRRWPTFTPCQNWINNDGNSSAGP
uniref:Uncharacterized protein n=1 Tax=Oryza rufipogon TaxID=4529 RepID=A0A0E0MXY1_ORYRU